MTEIKSSPELNQFVDKLLADKNLPELEPEVYQQLREDLLSRVEERINAELLASMTPAQVSEFSEILDTEDQAAIQNYLVQTFPDLESLVGSALIKFRNTYLGLS